MASGASTFRLDLISAIKARLRSQGFRPSSGDVSALVNDIEALISTESSTVLDDVEADVTAFSAVPLG